MSIKKIFSFREKIYKINCLCLIYDHDSTLFTLIAHGVYHEYMLLHYHNNYNRTVEIKSKMPGMHVYRSLPITLYMQSCIKCVIKFLFHV